MVKANQSGLQEGRKGTGRGQEGDRKTDNILRVLLHTPGWTAHLRHKEDQGQSADAVQKSSEHQSPPGTTHREDTSAQPAGTHSRLPERPVVA